MKKNNTNTNTAAANTAPAPAPVTEAAPVTAPAPAPVTAESAAEIFFNRAEAALRFADAADILNYAKGAYYVYRSISEKDFGKHKSFRAMTDAARAEGKTRRSYDALRDLAYFGAMVDEITVDALTTYDVVPGYANYSRACLTRLVKRAGVGFKAGNAVIRAAVDDFVVKHGITAETPESVIREAGKAVKAPKQTPAAAAELTEAEKAEAARKAEAEKAAAKSAADDKNAARAEMLSMIPEKSRADFELLLSVYTAAVTAGADYKPSVDFVEYRTKKAAEAREAAEKAAKKAEVFKK